MLLDLLFPNRCLHCNRIIDAEDVVCDACLGMINFTHWSYGEQNPMLQKCKAMFPTENAYALIHFEKGGLSQKIIHELKYRGREKIGKIFSAWIFERVNFGENKPDLLVNIPLHPKKEKERGYNQLHLLTEELSNLYKIPYDHNILKRNFYKKPQARKNKTERMIETNLFSLNKKIENQHLLIIDDVMTTGNTLSSVAWELLKSGNNKVSVLTIAVD
ncbi:MAG: double zinc ribbon domain-containing protein [Cruoricaptor ignavus]|nr:double zinc ribbon domain-containing protein [Cruoricaptor ignavus]